jgi:hypothetical protein
MTRARIGHLVVILVGVLIMLYPVTFSAAAITCRGEAMGPADVCLKADGQEQQTYEQRLAARSDAVPVIVGVGLLVTGFGTALLVGDVRRRASAAA